MHDEELETAVTSDETEEVKEIEVSDQTEFNEVDISDQTEFNEIETSTTEEIVEEAEVSEEKTEEPVEEDPRGTPVEVVQVPLELMNRFQLMLMMHSININNLVDKKFFVVTKKDNVIFDEETKQIKALAPNAILFLAKPNEDVEGEMTLIDIFDGELAIQDGNGMEIVIKPYDKVYIKNLANNITFKGIITGFGFNEDEQDVEIDLIITVNGRLSIVRYIYGDEGTKLFSRGSNITDKAREFIASIDD